MIISHFNGENKSLLLSSKNKQQGGLSKALCLSVATFALLQASNAYANPQGAQVVSGNITITTPEINKTVINQGSDKAIINWQSFDILHGETTQFIQPSVNSVALNRIRNGNPTKIFGTLTANGKIIIVNPSGVVFGAGSKVDVASLVATVNDIRNSDFLAGKTNFSIAGSPGAKIINEGTITAADGGLVALIGHSVRNDGVIQANMGKVILASGQTASIDFYGDNLYSFAVDSETTQIADGEAAAVSNNGIISVGGGKVVLTAKVAKNIVDNAINNTGVIEASSAYMDGGDIVLSADGGNVNVSGKLNASSAKKGGNVTVTGDNIILAKADIDASGKTGGGKVRIGGDYQGGGELATAKTVTTDKESKINVSATDSGNAGTAIVWSDEATDFNATIAGTGGTNGGDGGFAEISSKGELGFDGSIDLSAANGNAGTLLLDPGSLFLGNFIDHAFAGDLFVNIAPLVTALDGGANVIALGTNNVSVLADMVWSGAGNFTINAGNNAIIESDIRSFFNGAANQGAININSGTSVQMGNANIWTKRGDITINTGEMKMSSSTIKSSLGNVAINNTGRFGSNIANVLGGKVVTLNQDITGFIQNAVDAISNVETGEATVTLGNGTWNENVVINGKDNLTIQGSGATVVNPLAAADPVFLLNNTHNAAIKDLSIGGGEVGVSVNNSSLFELINSLLHDNSRIALALSNTNNVLVTNNNFLRNNVAISGIASDSVKVIGNEFYRNFTGVKLKNAIWSKVENNLFSGVGIAVILDNIVGAPISNNIFNFTDTGVVTFAGNSIFINDNTMNGIRRGIDSSGTTGLTILDNIITGFTKPAGLGLHAVNIVDGLHTSIKGNDISNFTNGVLINNSNNSRIDSNNINNMFNDAVSLNKNTHTLVIGNTINNARNGVFADSNSKIDIVDNNISNTNNGVLTNGNSALLVLSNNIFDNIFGIVDSNSILTKIIDNTISDNSIGLIANSATWLTVDNNRFLGNPTGGIFNNVVGSIISNNLFEQTGAGIITTNGNSLFVRDNIMNKINMGIISNNSTGLTIIDNNINGSDGGAGAGLFAISVDGGLNTSIKDNIVDNFVDGVIVQNSNNSRVDSNNITNIIKDAIFLDSNISTLTILNIINKAGSGIHSLSNNFITIANNSVENANNGIFAENSTNLSILTNALTDNSAGINVVGSDNSVLNDNTLTNNLFGVIVNNSDNVNLTSNDFIGNGTGASFFDSDNATLTGDIFTGNVLGINLDNSQNTNIREAIMSVPNGGVGMLIQNGSGGTLVRGLDISGVGNSLGVLIDGAGSSMQFDSNTSRFSGLNQYFVLQNNAMFGDTLDASAQFFEGVRASDFTVAQRDAAEAKTIDVEDGIPTIGNVFYKNFPVAAFLAPASLTRFQQAPPLGLFSYAGRTITNDPGVTPPQFNISSLNLSLLSPAAGGADSGAVNPAGLTPDQLGGLEPAAGGDNPLASLSPAAGGLSCGNNFLGSGFNNGFNLGTCNINQQQ
ncbi:MAG: NosD domain-containing protein [Rickettsiales bacterium]